MRVPSSPRLWRAKKNLEIGSLEFFTMGILAAAGIYTSGNSKNWAQNQFDSRFRDFLFFRHSFNFVEGGNSLNHFYQSVLIKGQHSFLFDNFL